MTKYSPAATVMALCCAGNWLSSLDGSQTHYAEQLMDQLVDVSGSGQYNLINLIDVLMNESSFIVVWISLGSQ